MEYLSRAEAPLGTSKHNLPASNVDFDDLEFVAIGHWPHMGGLARNDGV